ncbi:MAG: PEP-CTERM sorting domain-containing protein [Kiritimatiellales bacterium]|nr:PEP-CTERM sorting domain-containing protein [Kiritimatiellales bacterium]MCF7864796.1 PEP-CTERM sorting domain-containing protein [Kiritimatiellales bacterium]
MKRTTIKRVEWIVALSMAVCVHADMSILDVSKDTMLRSATTADAADLGGATTAYFRGTGTRVIMEFDLGGLGQTVTNAVLKIRQASNVSGAYNVQVFSMVYTANNYAWLQGVGSSTGGTDASAPADASGAASYLYRFNGTTDLAWEDGSGTGVSDAGAAALWGAEIGQETGTGWASGTYSSIVLDAATIEASRTGSGKITIGLWDADGLGVAGNFNISAMEAATAAYRPVMEVMTIPEPATLGLVGGVAIGLLSIRRFFIL